MRIGLLGGSFNPAHLGHLYISLEAKKRLNLKQIWWLPAKQNPLKKIKNSAFEKRFSECQKITENYSDILIKDYEKKLAGNYSIDLLKTIIRQHRRHKFFWIMGADNLAQFHQWRNWQEIIKLTPLIVIDRDNYFNRATKSKAAIYARKLENSGLGSKLHFLKIKKNPQSSSKIRTDLIK
jgi:nicotinate-nucleotide adenylyltransferase